MQTVSIELSLEQITAIVAALDHASGEPLRYNEISPVLASKLALMLVEASMSDDERAQAAVEESEFKPGVLQ